MPARPCRPNADLEKLWRNFFGGRMFPACGIDEAAADQANQAADAVHSAPEASRPAEPAEAADGDPAKK